MNKKTIHIALFTFIFTTVVCCQEESTKDNYYFNGDIRYVDTNSKVVKNVTTKTVSLDGTYSGMIAVYDSLFICWHPRFPNHFFNVFNVDTGEELGSFCEKGQGAREAVSVNCVYQLFKKDNDLMTQLYTNEGKLFFWNISQSVKKGITVYDTIIPYKNDCMFFHFYQSEDILLAFRAADYLSRREVTTPFYEKRMIYTNELIRDYPIYKQPSIQNENPDVGAFYTWDVIKPDGSKIVQAMNSLPQINIIDTHTGDIIGFRMKNGPDFSFLEADMKSTNKYYNSVQADNKYIYATYWGKESWSGRIGDESPFINTIHVFDWNGKLLYELITDRPFLRSIWLDQAKNRLYTIDIDTDEVYYLDLEELNL